MNKLLFMVGLILSCPALYSQNPTAKINTSSGIFEIELYFDKTPKTVSNFISLVENKFFENLTFHRIIEEFMVQTGDPNADNTGGPGYSFSDEFHPSLKHTQKGVVSMANSGPDTNGSQFFITLAPAPHLDGKHTIFAQVTKGIEVIEQMAKSPTKAAKPIKEITIKSVSLLNRPKNLADWQPLNDLSETEAKKIIDKEFKGFFKTFAKQQHLGKLLQYNYDFLGSKGARIQTAIFASFSNAPKVKFFATATRRHDGTIFFNKIQFERDAPQIKQAMKAHGHHLH